MCSKEPPAPCDNPAPPAALSELRCCIPGLTLGRLRMGTLWTKSLVSADPSRRQGGARQRSNYKQQGEGKEERGSKKKARGQGVDVRHGQLHAAGSKFLLASESNVRHYRPLPGGPFRPSLPCCLSAALVWRGVRFEGLRAAVWSYIISCRIAMFAVLNGLMSGY